MTFNEVIPALSILALLCICAAIALCLTNHLSSKLAERFIESDKYGSEGGRAPRKPTNERMGLPHLQGEGSNMILNTLSNPSETGDRCPISAADGAARVSGLGSRMTSFANSLSVSDGKEVWVRPDFRTFVRVFAHPRLPPTIFFTDPHPATVPPARRRSSVPAQYQIHISNENGNSYHEERFRASNEKLRR